MRTAMLWFRQDLRLADNSALHDALKQFDRVVMVYVHAPCELGEWSPGEASQWWLHHSLSSLESSVQKLGGRLIIRSGSSLEQLSDIAKQAQVNTLFFNRAYDPILVERDREIVHSFKNIGIKCREYNGLLLFNPEHISTQTGSPYRVFTPFWNKFQSLFQLEQPLPVPNQLNHAYCSLDSTSIDDLGLLSQIRWYDKLHQYWQPGEDAAQDKLESFLSQNLIAYSALRDRPDVNGTSLLSPHLHFGEISPRQLLWRSRIVANSSIPGLLQALETFTKELVWREFAYYTLHHYPRIIGEPLNERYRNFPYAKNREDLLLAWQTGRTGFPLVDAGMRQLWESGTMHNRVRMIVASFLTKNALISWKRGARWFLDTLVDADLASNTFNWQWVAGCGADAAPFFRIFNPISQSQKFDPVGKYIKQWLPELARMPQRYIHEPWKMPAAVQKDFKIFIGKTYPSPIIDLKQTRQTAIDLFQRHVKTGV